MPANLQVAHFLLDGIQPKVVQFIQESSSAMIGIIGPLATSLLAIYVLLWGAMLASGQVSEPFTDFMRRVIRIALIVALALTAGVYQNMVADTFLKGPMEIASKMTFADSVAVKDADSMAAVLDDLLSKGMAVAEKPWEKGKELNSKAYVGFTSEGLTLEFLALVLMLTCVLTVAVAAGLMFVAFIALGILLAIGPLFILFAIFPATQRWMEAWLGQTVNYGVVFIIVSVASGLLFKILTGYYDSLVSSMTDPTEVLWIAIKAVGLAIACIGVLMQSNSIASGLAGGAAIQASNVAGRLAGMGTAFARNAAPAVRGAGSLAYGAARGVTGRSAGRELNARTVGHAAGQLVRARMMANRNSVSQT